MKVYIIAEHTKFNVTTLLAFSKLEDARNALAERLYDNGLRDGGSVVMESDIENDGFMFGHTDTDENELPEGYMIECIMAELDLG